jgi:glyoxylase I family protein
MFENFTTMKLNDIHHIAVICSDYARSKDFYTRILGLEVIRETYREERKSYKLDLALNGKYVIELFSFNGSPKRPSYPEATGLRHLAFEVDDVYRECEGLKELGIAVEPVRTDTLTGKAFAFFADPDDLPIEFYQK